MMSAMFGCGESVATVAEIAAACTDVPGTEADIVAAETDVGAKRAVITALKTAQDVGMNGAPFWGADRLVQLEARLAAAR